MKRTLAFIILAAILTTNKSLSMAPQQDPAPPAVNLFYTDLTPYGEWIEFEPGLYAWRPVNVAPDWRPYTAGRWVWSNYGWYWVTVEPFGWATYHYGRWYLDDTYGWIWIPDVVWGPAWVEWHCNDDYIGWAPLPPCAKFHVTVGIRFTARWVAPPVYWCFVSYNTFASIRPYHVYVSTSVARRIISTSRSAGRYEIDQNRIINRGIDRGFIERHSLNRVESAEITETRDRGVERFTRSGQVDRVEIYRPRGDESRVATERIEASRAQSRPSLDIDRIERYRSTPQRGENRGDNIQPSERFDAPNRQSQQPRSPERRSDRPEVRRERPLRVQPEFPSPRINRNVPNRPAESRDQGRTRGKGRDKF